jgi:hypothetical protein
MNRELLAMLPKLPGEGEAATVVVTKTFVTELAFLMRVV